MTTFSGIQTALSGLVAQQEAIDVTANNIANAGTDGYTKEVADLTSTASSSSDGVGSGVTVTAYQRVRDAYLDVQVRAQSMVAGYNDARSTALQQVDQSLNEPSDTGLSATLQNFWSSWQSLAASPSSASAQQAVVSAAGDLTDGIQSLAGSFQNTSDSIDGQTSQAIGTLSSDVAGLAAINTQLTALGQGGGATTNTLLDQRDNLLDKISGLVNVSSTTAADGSVTLKVGSFTLLSGGTASPVATIADFGTNPQTGLSNVTSGTIGGLQSLKATVAGYSNTLNGIATSLISQVNAAQAAGARANGSPTSMASLLLPSSSK